MHSLAARTRRALARGAGVWLTTMLCAALLGYGAMADELNASKRKFAGPTTHLATVNTDGTFLPMWTSINSGDTVHWHLSARTDSVIPATWSGAFPAICDSPRAYDESDPNNFTGPMPLGPSGIYTISPVDRGLAVETGSCSSGNPKAVVGTDYLCETGSYNATMDSTWESPDITGVFIRLKWKDVHIAPRTADTSFDFTVLDREIAKAVANGKLYSLAFNASKSGTPDWIFDADRDGTPRPNGGVVERLLFQDQDGSKYGALMQVGNPTNLDSGVSPCSGCETGRPNHRIKSS